MNETFICACCRSILSYILICYIGANERERKKEDMITYFSKLDQPNFRKKVQEYVPWLQAFVTNPLHYLFLKNNKKYQSLQ